MAIPRTAAYIPSEWGCRFHARRENEVFGAGAAGPGKALSLETLVPTPSGIKRFGDIHPGDTVFDMHGKQVKVIAETEVWTDRPCYLMKIGQEKLIADANHIWMIDGGFPPMTTEEIHNSPFTRFVPSAPAVEMEPKKLMVDPYVLGVCLVKGQKADRSKFSSWDMELFSILDKIGYTLEDVSYHISRIKERADIINELIPPTGRRIPVDYMLGSFNQRLALVEGIMDGNRGKGPFVKKKDFPFLRDFIALCASCGLGPEYHRYRYGDTWTVSIKSGKYKCTRRVGRKIGAELSIKRRFGINRTKRVKSVPVKCIQVEGNTFLITESYIPTHNSMVLLADPLEQVWIEHVRCQQEKVPEAFPEDIKKLVEKNPLRWGHSEGWIIHLRRTMPRLEETINRAHRMFPLIDPDADWSEKKSTWTFSSGIKYQFGHCKDRTDYNNYLGKQYTYIGWDELVEFNKEQYDFIGTRLRTADPVLRHLLKNRSMSNPKLSGNKGEDIQVDDPAWVKRHFVDPCPEGNKVLRRKVVRRDGSIEYVTKLYLPATLYDNPDKEFVKQYELELMSKPKHIRDCYLYGRWDTIIGSFFGEDWNPGIHICKPFKIPQDWPVFRSLDWGFQTHGNLGYYAIRPEPYTVFKFYEVTFKKIRAGECAVQIIQPFEKRNKLWDESKDQSMIYGPADTQIWEERGESAQTKYMEFVENGVDWCYADKKSREDNASTLAEMLLSHENYTKPPQFIVFENCKNTIQVIPAMETDPNNSEVPKKGGFDHPYDETTYALRYAKGRFLTPPNYKGKIDVYEPEEESLEPRGGWGYWQG